MIRASKTRIWKQINNELLFKSKDQTTTNITKKKNNAWRLEATKLVFWDFAIMFYPKEF